MPRANAPLYALNGGEIGLDAVGRLDLERVQRTSELCENIFPTVIGRMNFRPGFEYIEPVATNGSTGVRLLPFVVSATNRFILAFTTAGMRVLRDDAYISRAAVSTTVQNGEFNAIAGWVDASTGTASAGVDGNGNLQLVGQSGSRSIARQEVTVAGSDQNTEHGLAIDVVRGPAILRIGTTSGGDDLFSETSLEEGSHSIGFTPGGASFWIQFSNPENRDVLVNSATIESSGDIVLSHPWDAENLRSLQFDQSLDVLFVSSQDFQQRRIERRGNTSWSIVRYKTFDGPFEVRSETDLTLAPSVIAGVGTLTASTDFFSSGSVGSLIRLTHTEQRVERSFTGPDQTGDSIRVTGVGNTRIFNVSVTVSVDDGGTPEDEAWNGTVTLEQSIGEEGNWVDLRTYTGNANQSVDDDLDNQIVFYRLRVDAGDHTNGVANTVLTYAGGQTQGIARVVGFTSATVVDMEVLRPFGSTSATSTWSLGSWSDNAGWPNSVVFHDGRLWWGRGDQVYGSVSDQFASFDTDVEGDRAPVIRSVGARSEQGLVWLSSLQRLIAGTDVSEISIRASSFDEPLTATAFAPRDASTRGCAEIAPVKVDTSAVFVQRSNFRIFDLFYDAASNDYISRDVTELHNDICRPGVVSMAVQRQPDTRIWFVLSDGTARVLTYEPKENVLAWSRVVIDGDIEDVVEIPSTDEDFVYIATRRTINGNAAVRSIERLANSREAQGGQINKIADSFVQITHNTPSATIDGLDHLEGEQVVVWADGAAIHDQSNMATVSGGAITNTTPYTNIVVGLPYNGRWRSTKLAYGAALGTALTQKKRVDHLGLYMVHTAPEGLRMGRELDNVTQVATTYNDRPITAGQVFEEWDQDATHFNGGWSTDSRVNFVMMAPYPVSIAAMTINMKTNDRG